MDESITDGKTYTALTRIDAAELKAAEFELIAAQTQLAKLQSDIDALAQTEHAKQIKKLYDANAPQLAKVATAMEAAAAAHKAQHELIVKRYQLGPKDTIGEDGKTIIRADKPAESPPKKLEAVPPAEDEKPTEPAEDATG
jgi:hypothetical protein